MRPLSCAASIGTLDLQAARYWAVRGGIGPRNKPGYPLSELDACNPARDGV